MSYAVVQEGQSRSFPKGDVFLKGATNSEAAEILVVCGARYQPDERKTAILIELGTESLAEHTGDGCQHANVLGFARYRNGDDMPSPLIELVCPASASQAAIDVARKMFEVAGLEVVVCSDQIGRIINRLVLPKYNAALRFLDEGLATQSDMDLTCKLGLGYPDGPIERVVRGGLARLYEVTHSMFETYGTSSYAPPRRAMVAARRKQNR